MIEGDYEFLIGGETLRLSAGSLHYVPKGTLHAHWGVGEGVGRMLLTQTPGGLYEHFFEQVGKKAVDGEVRPPDFEEQQDMRTTWRSHPSTASRCHRLSHGSWAG